MPLKVGEIIGLIESDGWTFNRQAGNHRQYKHPTKKGTFTVAGKPGDDVRPGTEASIKRQTGI